MMLLDEDYGVVEQDEAYVRLVSVELRTMMRVSVNELRVVEAWYTMAFASVRVSRQQVLVQV
jgi:hypothetical protein